MEAPEFHFVEERVHLLFDVDKDGSQTSVWTLSSLTRIVFNTLPVKAAVAALARHRFNQHKFADLAHQVQLQVLFGINEQFCV